jgi:hypothetical protein
MEEGDEGGWRGTIEDGEVKRKTEKKSNSRRKSSRNGADPSHGSSRKAGSRG